MKFRAFFAATATLLAMLAATTADSPPNLQTENLVAWCIVPFDAKKRGPAERAQMLEELGLRRSAYDWRKQHVPEFEEEIRQYRKHGIEFFAFWGTHEAAFALFEKYGLHPQIWQTLRDPGEGSQAQKVEAAAKAMEGLATRTAELGCKLGLYNHGGWGGEPANLVAVCKRMRKMGHEHVGIVYNWHHGHGHIADWAEALAMMKPYLHCLNLNGMNDGAEPKILTLAQGKHETAMLQAVRESGYDGPIGILDHQSHLDTKKVLQDNLDGLERLKSQLAEPVTSWSYPPAKRQDLIEKRHGVQVADPYRWLEDVDSAETKAWVRAQNALSDEYFAQAPGRQWIEQRLTELWDYEKFGLPRNVAGRLFYTKKTGLQNQSVLYWREDAPDAKAKVLLDPNLFSKDGTIALSGWDVSEDGKLLAYGISEGGSDWMEWKVRNIDSGEDLPDHLKWIKFSGVSWTKDGSGFYYSRYPEPKDGERLEAVNLNQKVYFHRIGEQQSNDRLIYERPDRSKWGYSAWESEDGRYFTLSVWEASGDKNAFFVRDLQAGEKAPFIELIPRIEHEYSVLGNDGPLFYFKTNKNAPNGRIIAIDSSSPNPQIREIIPETQNPVNDANLIGNRLLLTYMIDVLARVKVFDLEGNHERDVKLPGVGSIWGFGGRRDARETFYYYSSYTTPGSVYRYDLERGSSAIFAEPEVAFDPESYETRQVFYPSKDGTQIPMFVTCRKDIQLDGSHPTYLYGYGGFDISLTPYYSTAVAVWLEMGGVYAVANLRGGGEYGEKWHLAGTKERKQNVFDDFQAAAMFLISEGYTNRQKLAIAGGSNGGLLVGACLNQRPELFGAAIAQVGVFDMLRFHKFTIGWAWTGDFGDPDKAEEFPALYAYSPYHRTQTERPYPATLITTADHDDRVFPAHSFKFGAALQHAQTGDRPILLRIETKAGHGAGKPTSKQIEEIVDRWSFLAKELKIEVGSK